MEDAMILNKGSYERGFCHGTVIKSQRINLKEGRESQASCIFGKLRSSASRKIQMKLDPDLGHYIQYLLFFYVSKLG